MLSKVSTLILGMIAESPINPYEITKLTDYIGVKNWLSLPAQSVYSTIKTLNEKGYITGQNIKEGNMPEKTVYSITETGKEQLICSLEEFLGNTEWDFAKFNIATIMLCHISKDKAIDILQNKLKRLETKRIALEENLNELNKGELLKTGIHAVKHMINITLADIASTEELLEIIQSGQEWNRFLSTDMRLYSNNN